MIFALKILDFFLLSEIFWTKNREKNIDLTRKRYFKT